VTEGPDLVVERPARVGREAGLVGLAGLAVALVHYQVWRARFSEPFTPGGDADFYAMVVQGLGRNGQYFDNPDLGWPFAQQLHDVPQGVDNLNLLVLRVLVAITGKPWAAIHAYFFLTFMAVAAGGYVAFRYLGIRRWVAVLFALIYDFAPYHFIRGEQHLLLSGYHLVPLGLVLALSMFNAEPPLSRRRADGKARPTVRKHWWTVALIVAIGSSGSYYLVFTLGLVVVAAVLATVRKPSWRPAVAAGAVVAIGAATFVANVSPSLMYYAKQGQNAGVVARSPVETELYGLRISQLFVPRESHRIAPLAKISRLSQGSVVPSESGQQLGGIGVIGLFVIVGAVGATALGRTKSSLVRKLVPLGLIAIVCMVVATVSGFAFFISAAGLSYIRSWNRISIFLAFLALVGTACSLEWWLDRKPRSRGLLVGIGVMLMAITFVDQMSPTDVPLYKARHDTFVSNTQLFQRVAADQGRGAGVLMWPHVPFPESTRRGSTGAYDQVAGYIVEPDLRYSFGFVSGRHPDFPLAFEAKPAAEWLTDAVAVGYRALVIDRYASQGVQKMADVEPTLLPILGAPTMVSADSRYAYFDLRAFAADATATLGADAPWSGSALRAAVRRR
jgi:phosphoglycerol transferase